MLLFFDFDLGNKWINMSVNSILVVIGFPVILYFAKIDPEIVEYVDKFLMKLNLKLRKKN
jgi:hypothetical protein